MPRQRVTEGSSQAITPFTIPLPVTSPVTALTVATLTLYDVLTYQPATSPPDGILNGRDGQDVLAVADVTISEAGVVNWTMQPEDAVIVTPRRQIERHRAEFHFEWDGGGYNYAIDIEVENLGLSSRSGSVPPNAAFIDAGQVAYATGANTLGGDAGLTYDGASNPTFTLGSTVNGSATFVAGGAGKQLFISAANGVSGSGEVGGELTITSGRGALNGNGDGGDLILSSGIGFMGAQSGNVSLTSGVPSDDGDSGSLTLGTGNAAMGQAGTVSILAGTGSNANNAGSVSIGGKAVNLGVYGLKSYEVNVNGHFFNGPFGADIVFSDGIALKTDTTTAHTALLQAYDVNGTTYRTFLTLTNGDVPSCEIREPAGGTLVFIPPTSDPHVVGALWNNANVLTLSAG